MLPLPDEVMDAVRRDAKRCMDVIPLPAALVPEFYSKLEWAYDYSTAQDAHIGADVYTKWCVYRWINTKVPAVAKSDYYIDLVDLFAPLLRVKCKTKYPKVGKHHVRHVVMVEAQADETLQQEMETLCKLGIGTPERLIQNGATHLLYNAWKRVRNHYAAVDLHWTDGSWHMTHDPVAPMFVCTKRQDEQENDDEAGG